jgi:hypothetical protein
LKDVAKIMKNFELAKNNEKARSGIYKFNVKNVKEGIAVQRYGTVTDKQLVLPDFDTFQS